MSGAGTGSIIGQWLWDNRVVEQFAVNLVAGQSLTVRTQQPLPTWFLGGHTVQLRMQQPSQIATRPVTVVVTPAGWLLETLARSGLWSGVSRIGAARPSMGAGSGRGALPGRFLHSALLLFHLNLA